MGIERVGVVGFGAMGAGIAQLVAMSGFTVVARDVKQEFVDRGLARIDASLPRLVKSGRLTDEQSRAARVRITTSLDLAALKDCDLIIEAVIEVIDAKKEVFQALDAVCPSATIFASNTSSLTIVEMAAITKRMDRFAGLHFFNPPVMRPLVEIVQAITTSDATIDTLRGFVKRLGHTGVVCKDTSGFIVNRVLTAYLNAAVDSLERGVASPEDIDAAMRLGLGHPMGPLELIDYVGVDIYAHVCHILFDEFKDSSLAPPTVVRRMVQAGHLGVKSGKGFYEYNEKGKRKA